MEFITRDGPQMENVEFDRGMQFYSIFAVKIKPEKWPTWGPICNGCMCSTVSMGALVT